MSLKQKVEGLNKFLSTIYASDMRISILLSEAGFNAQEIDYLRQNHLNELVEGCVLLLNQRISAYSGGERLNEVITKRYGLNGEQSLTLQALGDSLKVSRERVRQLEQKVIRRFRGRKNHQLIEAGLRVIGDKLLEDNKNLSFSNSDLAPELSVSVAKSVYSETEDIVKEPTHSFAVVEDESGLLGLVIGERRFGKESSEILIYEDEIEMFRLSFLEALEPNNWKKQSKSYDVSEIRKNFPRAYEVWTIDEENRLKELYLEGEKASDIAKFLGRQSGAIRARLKKLKLVE